ncbi:MAG: MgtC/SapB family protein [Thermodesulfovibrionales bacterium]
MITTIEIIIRLLLGAILGGIIGFERQTHGRPAGFRTHLLVCVASVLIMIVSEYYYYLSLMEPAYIRIDPARIAAGAITGVGFLGAGVIVKTGLTVQGLTTAACLWIVSAIGLAIGSGLYTAGVVSFIITYFALWTLRIVEERISRLSYKVMTVVTKDGSDEDVITSAIQRCGAAISGMDYEKDMEKKESIYHITITFKDTVSTKKILDEVSSLQFVRRVVIRG